MEVLNHEVGMGRKWEPGISDSRLGFGLDQGLRWDLDLGFFYV